MNDTSPGHRKMTGPAGHCCDELRIQLGGTTHSCAVTEKPARGALGRHGRMNGTPKVRNMRDVDQRAHVVASRTPRRVPARRGRSAVHRGSPGRRVAEVGGRKAKDGARIADMRSLLGEGHG